MALMGPFPSIFKGQCLPSPTIDLTSSSNSPPSSHLFLHPSSPSPLLTLPPLPPLTPVSTANYTKAKIDSTPDKDSMETSGSQGPAHARGNESERAGAGEMCSYRTACKVQWSPFIVGTVQGSPSLKQAASPRPDLLSSHYTSVCTFQC